MINLISSHGEVACSGVEYHALIGALAEIDVQRSHLTAWPLTECKLETICYVALKGGRVPVVVLRRDDGSIRLSGAYINTIAMEMGKLGSVSLPRAEVP